jgi:hypothetical protein
MTGSDQDVRTLGNVGDEELMGVVIGAKSVDGGPEGMTGT